MTMTRRLVLLVSAALLGAVLTGGCDSEDSDEGIALLTYESGDGGFDGIGYGSIVIDDSGCLVLDDGAGESDILLLPPESALSADGQDLVHPDYGRLPRGEELQLHGGHLFAEDDSGPAGDLLDHYDVPERCHRERLFLVSSW